ncbi:MAG: hypothetical protein KDJ77_17725 [Rhodobiaceae bacterium]|nr:hypothetical protein [Rhodobiaceae bacterium]
MKRVSKIVLVTAAATGLSFSPVFACPYMKTSEAKKPMVTARADLKMSTTDTVIVKPRVEKPAEATPTTKPEDKAVSVE